MGDEPENAEPSTDNAEAPTAPPEPAPDHPEPSPAPPEPAPAPPEPAPAPPEPAPAHPEPAPDHPEPTPDHAEPAPAHPEQAPAHPEPDPTHPESAPAHPEPAPVHASPSKSVEADKSNSNMKQTSHVKVLAPITSAGAVASATALGDRKQRPSRESKSLMASDEAMHRPSILRRASYRASKSGAIVGSIISFRKGSIYGDYLAGAKSARYMNSYKLDSENPFNPEKVEKILQSVLEEALEDLTYDPERCPEKAKWVSGEIRARVKEFEFERYKLVVLVTIGEKKYQDLSTVVRFLWDTARDKYALYVHDNMYVYASALCVGLYFE